MSKSCSSSFEQKFIDQNVPENYALCSLQSTQWSLSKTHTDWWVLELAEDTVGFAVNTQGLINTQRKHARTKEYSIDLVENASLQNPHTLTHVSPSCDFTCDWSKLNEWSTPWQHRLSTRLGVARCGFICDCSELPYRLSLASRITFWLVTEYRQVNKLFFSVLVSSCVCAVDTKIALIFKNEQSPA